jgi:hypothetical protein
MGRGFLWRNKKAISLNANIEDEFIKGPSIFKISVNNTHSNS